METYTAVLTIHDLKVIERALEVAYAKAKDFKRDQEASDCEVLIDKLRELQEAG